MVTLNDGDALGACADTGAEISLITTAALDKAKVEYDWNSLSNGHPVKGITSASQSSKTIIVKLKFLHDDSLLEATVALSVIQSHDYRFLLGRDILLPLKFTLDSEGLALTDP